MKKNKYGGYNDLSGWTSHPGDENYDEYKHRVYQTWIDMLRRVYERETYKEVEVDKRWLLFSNFSHDIKELPGYQEWLEDRTYQLDKDIKIPGSKIYSPDTCMLVSRKENYNEMNERYKEVRSKRMLEKAKPVIGTSIKDGSTIEFVSVREAMRNGYLGVSNCLNGRAKTCGGYTWTYK